MKEKIHYVIEAALAVAVLVLFILFFAGNKKSLNPKEVVSFEGNGSEPMPIAFVEVDSLMLKYTYSLDLNDVLTKKYENSNVILTERARKFQAEVADFQKKVETNAFISRESAENQSRRLEQKQQELQQLQAQYEQEFAAEQFRLRESMREVIITQLQEYNKDKGYQFIFGKSNDNILYGNNAYDITAEVIEFLNMHYAANPSLKPD